MFAKMLLSWVAIIGTAAAVQSSLTAPSPSGLSASTLSPNEASHSADSQRTVSQRTVSRRTISPRTGSPSSASPRIVSPRASSPSAIAQPIASPSGTSPVLAPALFAESRNQGTERSELLTQEFTPAVPIETPVLKFPLQELRRGVEGWVTVSYVITPEGTVTNAVVDASSGSPHFERAALEAVTASVYEPALLNEVAVTSSINQRVIKFELNNRTYNSSGSSLRFQRYITDARNAYLTADWQTFEAALLQIENLEYLNRFENANYRMLRGLHAEKNDNVGEALEQYKLALNWGTEHLETPSTMLLLQHSFSLMIAEEDFVGAVRFVENIPQALWNEPPVQNILALADRLESQLAEHEYLVNFAEISDGGAWSLPVTRAVVNIQPEEGSTHIVEFRCDASYQRFETIEHASFVIPRSWGECVVRLAGEPGSTASIYQFHQ